MNAGARPAELSETINPRRRVEDVRSLFCPCYESCLDEALRMGWNSWTCVECERFDAPAVPRRSSTAKSARARRPVPEHA